MLRFLCAIFFRTSSFTWLSNRFKKKSACENFLAYLAYLFETSLEVFRRFTLWIIVYHIRSVASSHFFSVSLFHCIVSCPILFLLKCSVMNNFRAPTKFFLIFARFKLKYVENFNLWRVVKKSSRNYFSLLSLLPWNQFFKQMKCKNWYKVLGVKTSITPWLLKNALQSNYCTQIFCSPFVSLPLCITDYTIISKVSFSTVNKKFFVLYSILNKQSSRKKINRLIIYAKSLRFSAEISLA